MSKKYFETFDMKNFWNDNDYALKEYVNDPPSDELIKSIEEELGYKLPASYIELMKDHNGGMLRNACIPISTRKSGPYIEITGIFGIGREKRYSLCGSMGSRYMANEWTYPDIGIYFCDTPSSGHDMIALDYRKCGKNGEPEVVHIDQEVDYEITLIAKDFETFIKGLVNCEKL